MDNQLQAIIIGLEHSNMPGSHGRKKQNLVLCVSAIPTPEVLVLGSEMKDLPGK